MSENQPDVLRRDLSEKVVLVTGGGSGIGVALAEAFSRHGARVAIHYCHSNADTVSANVEKIIAAGGEAFSLQADFRSTTAVKQMINKVVDHFGRLDILVNNAGSMVARCRLEEIFYRSGL